jgi:hypothetical protein
VTPRSLIIMLKDYHFIDVWYRFYVKKGEEQADDEANS